jgi:hypothetical protein
MPRSQAQARAADRRARAAADELSRQGMPIRYMRERARRVAGIEPARRFLRNGLDVPAETGRTRGASDSLELRKPPSFGAERAGDEGEAELLASPLACASQQPKQLSGMFSVMGLFMSAIANVV